MGTSRVGDEGIYSKFLVGLFRRGWCRGVIRGPLPLQTKIKNRRRLTKSKTFTLHKRGYQELKPKIGVKGLFFLR